MKREALVILSGGQDSTTCLFWADRRFDEIHALTFDYNQRHHLELEAAKKVATLCGVKSHEVLEVGPVLNGQSPLIDPTARLELYDNYSQMDSIIGDRVELTFVPMRNALFLVLAANRALCRGIKDIVTGVCQQDNANYPDCRQDFIESMEETINRALGLTGGARILIHTPLMDLTKAETVKLAKSIPECWDALAYTHTAYDGKYPPTSHDHASTLRAQGFLEAGEPDPLVVRAWRAGLMDLPATPNYASLGAQAGA